MNPLGDEVTPEKKVVKSVKANNPGYGWFSALMMAVKGWSGVSSLVSHLAVLE